MTGSHEVSGSIPLISTKDPLCRNAERIFFRFRRTEMLPARHTRVEDGASPPAACRDREALDKPAACVGY